MDSNTRPRREIDHAWRAAIAATLVAVVVTGVVATVTTAHAPVSHQAGMYRP